MTEFVPRLSGEDWQLWANQLLTLHYGPMEYQKVPDKDRGDAGIEGFTISKGHAFQAYGCEEPLSTTDRYEKQRDKMTVDVAKFIKNQTTLAKLFGTVKVSRWTLFVPIYDSKEIIAHATKKTSEVVAANLSYIAPDFRVMVCQEDDFLAERNELLGCSPQGLHLQAAPATADEVAQWTLSNDALATSLERKLRKLPMLVDEAARGYFRDNVLKWYLEGQAILDGLRIYPFVYEKVVKTKAHRENYLVMASISGGAPQGLLLATVQELLQTFQKEVRSCIRSLQRSSLTRPSLTGFCAALSIFRSSQMPINQPPMLSIPELDIQFIFRKRPIAVPGDLRPGWRIGLIALLLLKCCRAGRTSITRLHVLSWGIRTGESRKALLVSLSGRTSPDSLIVRFEPSLNRAVDFAVGEGLVRRESGSRIQLTDRGRTLAEQIDAASDAFMVEKDFIATIRQSVTEEYVSNMFQSRLV